MKEIDKCLDALRVLRNSGVITELQDDEIETEIMNMGDKDN